ncbi:MAG: LysR substrate-binding domain-containing protein [Gammaproteobacteria bacterium]
MRTNYHEAMLDRFTSMQVFLALVRRGTFAAAAEELGISRAMASKHIQALEDHLGLRLFNRTTRTTRLTEPGERYYERVYRLLNELDNIEARLSEEVGSVRGMLAIAAPPAFGAFHVAPVVGEFMRTYPDVQVRLVLADRPIDLVDEGIDVAITVRELADTSYIARRLSAVRMLVCAAPAYLTAHGRPRNPEDLVAHNCLIYSETPTHMHAEWQFRRGTGGFGVRVHGNFVSNVGNAIRNLALAGQGIARLPDYIVADDINRGTLAEVLARFSPPLRPVYALYPHRDHLPGKVVRFLDFAARSFANEPRQDGAEGTSH